MGETITSVAVGVVLGVRVGFDLRVTEAVAVGELVGVWQAMMYCLAIESHVTDRSDGPCDVGGIANSGPAPRPELVRRRPYASSPPARESRHANRYSCSTPFQVKLVGD